MMASSFLHEEDISKTWFYTVWIFEYLMYWWTKLPALTVPVLVLNFPSQLILLSSLRVAYGSGSWKFIRIRIRNTGFPVLCVLFFYNQLFIILCWICSLLLFFSVLFHAIYSIGTVLFCGFCCTLGQLCTFMDCSFLLRIFLSLLSCSVLTSSEISCL